MDWYSVLDSFSCLVCIKVYKFWDWLWWTTFDDTGGSMLKNKYLGSLKRTVPYAYRVLPLHETHVT